MKNKSLIIYFIAVFLKYLPMNFIYKPLQDDYIQYYAYPRYPNVYNDVIKRIGILNVRPFAGLFDVYIWGRFWYGMTAVLFIITILYYISFLLFKNVFGKMGYKTDSGFAIVYLLCPIGFEATYWISASSRIVVSLFFMSLMLWAVTERKYILFNIAFVLSMGFYEQTAFLGSVMLIWVLTECVKQGYFPKKEIYSCVIVWSVTFLYYILFAKTGSFGVRSENVGFGVNKVYNALFAMADGWISTKDLFVGEMRLSGGLIAVSIIFSLIFLLKCDNVKERPNRKMVLGMIFFISPYIVYMMIGEKFMPYRCHMPSLIGLGLIADNIINTLTINAKRAVICIMTMFFMLGNMYQSECYEKINMYDRLICKDIVNNLSGDYENEDIYVYNVKPLYIDVLKEYERYILPNLTASDWALTGGVRAFAENLHIKRIVPTETEDVENE